MIFACQRDSYIRSLSTTVTSCKHGTLQQVVDGRKVTVEGYEVTFEDTVLFPEGGGQPDDRGTANGIPVIRIFRNNGTAIHFLASPLGVGENVELVLDWGRRYDHMQQHSGQHLITAVAEDEFSFHTTSWNLGDEVSTIELDAPSGIKPEHISKLEFTVNEKIRQCVPVNVKLYEPGSEELNGVRTRMKIPDGEGDTIRVVIIEGVDSNLCCGTHVSNLSHIQVIKLLYTEKGKQGKTNLFFVAGERVLKYLGKAVQRERKMTTLLKCCPEEHAAMTEKLNLSLKLANKNALSVLRDLAVAEAKIFKLLEPRPKFYSYHRREGDNEFMTIFDNEVCDKSIILLLTTGDEKGAGQFLLSGPESVVAEYGPKVCEVIEGKGFFKHGKYQGKANKLSKKAKAEELIKDAFCNGISS